MLWVVAICASLVACVVGIVKGVMWQALWNLVVVVADCIFLGWCVCKFNAYREFAKTQVEIDTFVKEFMKVQKAKESEPFNEFEE